MINTLSAWNYGHTITKDNQYINYTELGSSEKSATIEIGDYTLGEFANAVASALNEDSDQEYTVNLDRTTRKLTITAPGNFELLASTGSQVNISAFNLMGFTSDTGAGVSHEGDEASGSQYSPQYYLQDFSDFDLNQRAVASSVNESALGDEVEVVTFGQQKRMSCKIDYVKNGKLAIHLNKTDQGLLELINFLEYITTKGRVEFLPDKDDPLTFTKCILDSSNVQNGTGFNVREDFRRNYYKSGELTFLRVK